MSTGPPAKEIVEAILDTEMNAIIESTVAHRGTEEHPGMLVYVADRSVFRDTGEVIEALLAKREFGEDGEEYFENLTFCELRRALTNHPCDHVEIRDGARRDRNARYCSSTAKGDILVLAAGLPRPYNQRICELLARKIEARMSQPVPA
jgi:hypothetical protein